MISETERATIVRQAQGSVRRRLALLSDILGALSVNVGETSDPAQILKTVRDVRADLDDLGQVVAGWELYEGLATHAG